MQIDIDAYTLRKIAPRILIAVIAINLSIYICIALAGIVDIIGKGVGNLIASPFIGAGNFDLNLTKGGGLAAIAEGVGATAAGGIILTTIAMSIVGGIAGGAGGIGGFIIFSILIPVVLIVLAVLITVAIRQGLLVFLTLVSPIAFALYILPNTEKFFHQWWDLYFKTLLMYPIIAVMFALSDVMGVLAVNSTPSSTTAAVIGLIFAFLPLVLIPFSFRFSGAAMSAVGNAARGAWGRINKDQGWLDTRQRHYKQQLKDSETRGRANIARRAARMESSGRAQGGVRGGLRRFAGSRIGNSAHGYTGSIFRAESELNKRMAEERELATGHGDDAIWRAYTWSGRDEDTRVQDGRQQIRTAGGAWVDRSYYDQAVRAAGGTSNAAMYQAGLAYEMGKATTQEEQDHLYSSFMTSAQNRGFTADESVGVWKGAAFAKQNENRQWKYYTPNVTENGNFRMGMNGLGLMREIDEKQGSYAGTMQNADTWTTMSHQMQQAHDTVGRLEGMGSRTEEQEAQFQEARETLTRGFRIAESLDQGYEVPVDPNDPNGPKRRVDSTGAGAPGRVGEEIRAFTKISKDLGGWHGYDKDQFGTQRRSDEPIQAIDDRSSDRKP